MRPAQDVKEALLGGNLELATKKHFFNVLSRTRDDLSVTGLVLLLNFGFGLGHLLVGHVS